MPLTQEAMLWLVQHSGVIDIFHHWITPSNYQVWIHLITIWDIRLQVSFRRPYWRKYSIWRRGVYCFTGYTWFMYGATPYLPIGPDWDDWYVWNLPRWAPGTRLWLRWQRNFGDGIWRQMSPILEVLIPT